tara:strand:- start:678 stop:1154 length:477 start_codon:yes stop_codon:yes gene_type:complete
MSKGFGNSKKSTKLGKVNKFKELKSKFDNAYTTLDTERYKLKKQEKSCKLAEQNLSQAKKNLVQDLLKRSQNKFDYGIKHKNKIYENIINDIKYVSNLINRLYKSSENSKKKNLKPFLELIKDAVDLESRTDNKIDVFSINLNLDTKKKLNTIVKRIH